MESLPVNDNIQMEGMVSQIFKLDLSFYVMITNRKLL